VLDLIEKCLARTQVLSGDQWFIEQTLYAVAVSVHGRVELLPKEYAMSLESHCSTKALSRHYIGAIWHLFYSEGLPRVNRNMRRGKQSHD
jgi:hypothetical protein